MSTKTFALSAGVPYPVHMSGEYFRILDSTGAVDVSFRSQNRALQDDAQGILAGFALALPAGKGFDYFELLSATSQNVQVFAGSSRVEYDRAAGSVAVTGTVFVAKAAQAAATGNGIATQTVGTASVGVLTAVSRRRAVFRSFDGNTADICLSLNTATMASPIRLGPGEMWVEEMVPSNVMNAIAGAAGQFLYVSSET